MEILLIGGYQPILPWVSFPAGVSPPVPGPKHALLLRQLIAAWPIRQEDDVKIS